VRRRVDRPIKEEKPGAARASPGQPEADQDETESNENLRVEPLPEYSHTQPQCDGRHHVGHDRGPGRLKGAITRIHRAAAWYSWMSPPRTSRRRTRGARRTGMDGGRSVSGGSRPSPRCGLAVLTTVDTSEVPPHQVGGDSVQPRDRAVCSRLHVGPATPSVEKGGRHEILRRAAVTRPSKAKREDGVRVTIKQLLEGLGLAGDGAAPKLGVRRLRAVTHGGPIVAFVCSSPQRSLSSVKPKSGPENGQKAVFSAVAFPGW